MNITSINCCMPKPNCCTTKPELNRCKPCPSFQGRVIALEGNWPNNLKDIFENSKILKKLAPDNIDIIGKISQKKKKLYKNNYVDVYKITLRSMPKVPYKFDKIADFLHIYPRHNLTKYYHDEQYTAGILKNIIPERIKEKLGLFDFI